MQTTSTLVNQNKLDLGLQQGRRRNKARNGTTFFKSSSLHINKRAELHVYIITYWLSSSS